MSAIETTGPTKRRGDVVALDGLDLAVRDGEVFGVPGPNGAGKSTTIDLEAMELAFTPDPDVAATGTVPWFGLAVLIVWGVGVPAVDHRQFRSAELA